MADVLNIASTLVATAARFPDRTGIVVPQFRCRSKPTRRAELTFRELNELSDRLSAGFAQMGVQPGTRIVLMVRPGIEFIALTYALFKCGAVVVLIDPGMGARRVFRCLDQVEPEGFVAIPAVQALRVLNVGRFPNARFNVTVGRRWFWGGKTYGVLQGAGVGGRGSEDRIRESGIGIQGTPGIASPPFSKGGPGRDAPSVPESPLVPTLSTDPAAIIFTSGSTGPAKGVVYEHGMFAAQVDALRDHYRIEPGGIDLPGFPLFALFNAAMGVTTVIPDMDPTRPAQVDPARIVRAIQEEGVTQGFGSPAIWNRVGRYCEKQRISFPTIQRIFLAGAPVSPDVLASMQKSLTGDGAELFTPYGATEALPVCSIGAREVLGRTAERTRVGAGTCVGNPFPQIDLRIIAITDGPIRTIAGARELPSGEIGEIIVRGAMVTREYFRQPTATANAKIGDGDTFWHRMGDVGYLDGNGALWFCGRKGHRVETEQGRMFTECVEPIFNCHPLVRRCALVGVGEKPKQAPVVVIECEPGSTAVPIDALRSIAREHETTRQIERFLFYKGTLPVDVRHNIKINREQLAEWAARKLMG